MTALSRTTTSELESLVPVSDHNAIMYLSCPSPPAVICILKNEVTLEK